MYFFIVPIFPLMFMYVSALNLYLRFVYSLCGNFLASQERVCKPTEGRQIGMIDPDCKVIALHIYTGLLKIIPLELDSGEELKAFNVRCVSPISREDVCTCTLHI